MPVSLWLRPEAAVADALDAAINRYALPHSRTPFPAHLTLASGEAISDADFVALAAMTPPLSLDYDGILETSTFYQAYALRYKASPELLSLRAKACDILGIDNAAYDPHISLTYGLPIEHETLWAMAQRFDQPVRFDRLIRVSYDKSEPSQAAVAAWRIGAARLLGA